MLCLRTRDTLPQLWKLWDFLSTYSKFLTCQYILF